MKDAEKPLTLLTKGFITDMPEVVPIEHIIKTLLTMRVGTTTKTLVLESSTGSGKSTVLPVHVYRKFGKIVLSIQPRVINAISLATRVAATNKDINFGETVGYYTGTFYRMPQSGVLFMTGGTFSQYIIHESDDFICAQYSCIIIDEAHELDIMSSNVHLFLRDFIRRCHTRPDCPLLIVTSATMDQAVFTRYYDATYIKVEGRSHPITRHFLEYSSDNYIHTAVETVLRIHREEVDDFKSESPERDILVFVSGMDEMNSFKKYWDRSCSRPGGHDRQAKSVQHKVALLFLNREIVQKAGAPYENLFRSAKELGVMRRVILSTNVGETGVTYPYLKYVVDTGFFKSKEYIYDYNVYFFYNKSISAMSALQRMGRAGRTAPGHFYAIYTEEVFNNMSNVANNGIYKDDISLAMLQLIASLCREGKRGNFINILRELIYVPAVHAIWRAMEKLYILGFVDSTFQITKLGDIAARMGPMSVECLKIILSGYIWHAPIVDLITVAWAIQNPISVQSHAVNRPGGSLFAQEAQCDFLPVVEDFYLRGAEGLLRQDYIQFVQIRDQIIDNLAVAGMDPYMWHEAKFPHGGEDYIRRMKQCIYEGLKLNTAVRDGQLYRTITGMDLPLTTIHDRAPSPFMTKAPHVDNFVYGSVTITYDIEGKMRKRVQGISILDGHVNFTPDFF